MIKYAVVQLTAKTAGGPESVVIAQKVSLNRLADKVKADGSVWLPLEDELDLLEYIEVGVLGHSAKIIAWVDRCEIWQRAGEEPAFTL